MLLQNKLPLAFPHRLGFSSIL